MTASYLARTSHPLLVILALTAPVVAPACTQSQDLGDETSDAQSHSLPPDGDASTGHDSRTSTVPPSGNDAGLTDAKASRDALTTVDGGDTGQADAGHDAAPPSDGSATPEYLLHVTESGFAPNEGSENPTEFFVWLYDITAGEQAQLMCGNYTDQGTDPQYNELQPGHTYAWEYMLPSVYGSNTVFCNAGPSSPVTPSAPHNVNTFGPVTGDTTINITPSDPSVSASAPFPFAGADGG